MAMGNTVCFDTFFLPSVAGNLFWDGLIVTLILVMSTIIFAILVSNVKKIFSRTLILLVAMGIGVVKYMIVFWCCFLLLQ